MLSEKEFKSMYEKYLKEMNEKDISAFLIYFHTFLEEHNYESISQFSKKLRKNPNTTLLAAYIDYLIDDLKNEKDKFSKIESRIAFIKFFEFFTKLTESWKKENEAV